MNIFRRFRDGMTDPEMLHVLRMLSGAGAILIWVTINVNFIASLKYIDVDMTDKALSYNIVRLSVLFAPLFAIWLWTSWEEGRQIASTNQSSTMVEFFKLVQTRHGRWLCYLALFHFSIFGFRYIVDGVWNKVIVCSFGASLCVYELNRLRYITLQRREWRG